MQKKRRRKSNFGQLNLSFGMIFSIIMIVLFISVAFYAIQKFLSLQNSAQAAKFWSDFQSDVNRVWKSSQSSEEISYFIPSKITAVCLADYSSSSRGPKANYYSELKTVYSGNENFFFYPIGSAEGIDSTELKNVDIAKTTADENPFCIDSGGGKVKIRIKKDFSDSLVTIAR